MVEECTICYEGCHQDEFFLLNYCHGKKICHPCLECLSVPLCPYCRRIIPEIKDHSRYRMAVSMPDTSSSFLLAHYQHRHDDNINHDLFTSRILRRRLKRFRKLELREEDRLRNQARYHSV